jgi:hypothetical protein
MKILKKITGTIILLIIISLFFLACYLFPLQLESCRKKIVEGAPDAPGYVFGFITYLVLYLIFSFFLIKLSLKLIREKKQI